MGRPSGSERGIKPGVVGFVNLGLFADFWGVMFGFVGGLVVQKALQLLVEILAVGRVDHVELFFVDQAGLQGGPFLPGLLGHGFKQAFAFFTGHGGLFEAW